MHTIVDASRDQNTASDSLELALQSVVRCKTCMLNTDPRSSGATIPPASNFMMILIKGTIETTIGKTRKMNTSLKVETYLLFV